MRRCSQTQVEITIVKLRLDTPYGEMPIVSDYCPTCLFCFYDGLERLLEPRVLMEAAARVLHGSGDEDYPENFPLLGYEIYGNLKLGRIKEELILEPACVQLETSTQLLRFFKNLTLNLEAGEVLLTRKALVRRN